jgi:hypothetical protein
MLCKNQNCRKELPTRTYQGGRVKVFCSKECKNSYHYQERRKLLISDPAAQREWLGQSAAYRRAHYAKNPGSIRKNNLKRYNLTPQQYDLMLAKQGGVCAICGASSEGNLSVDHDHTCCPGNRSCGKCIRGLLCDPCNQAIGLLKDDPNTVEAAQRYLRGGRATAYA